MCVCHGNSRVVIGIYCTKDGHHGNIVTRSMKLFYLLVCGLLLFLDWQVTNVGEPSDSGPQSDVTSAVADTQVTGTLTSVLQEEPVTLTEHLESSTTTSLLPSQSESTILPQHSESTVQLEPSFIELQETSVTQESVQETVSQPSQSSVVEQSHDLSPDQSPDLSGQQKPDVISDNTQSTESPEPLVAVEHPTQDSDEVRKVTEQEEEVSPEESVINTTLVQEPDVSETEDKKSADEELSHIPEGVISGGKPEPGLGGSSTDMPEEGLTFNEWTQKILAEAEKGRLNAEGEPGSQPPPVVKQRKRKNYASHDCGAKILASNPEAINPRYVLNANKDEYMNNPCKAKRWFVIELCEPIQAHSVEIASLELFSSQPKSVRVALSDRFPTKDWKLAGEFVLKDERAIQQFVLKDLDDYFAKFVKVDLVDHYGDEHFCPLTIFRMWGIAVTDYEDDHTTEPEEEDEEGEEESLDEEEEGGSKNLFTSAKNTVMNIVKKVLYVNSEEEGLIKNGSEITATASTESPLNTTTPGYEDAPLPCVPDAVVGSLKDSADDGDGESKGIRPQPPQPGQTDRKIVVKLEDDEQIETSPDLVAEPVKSLPQHICDCFETLRAFYLQYKKYCIKQSQLCQFVYLVSKQSSPEVLQKDSKKKLIGEGRVETEVPKEQTISSSEVVSSLQESFSPVIVTDSTALSESSVLSETEHSASSTAHVSDEATSVLCQSKDNCAITQTSEHTDVAVKPTSATEVFQQTVLSTSSYSASAEHSQVQSGSLPFSSRSASQALEIDPSPSSIATPSGTTAEMSGEATPALPDSWKPDTKDLLQDRTSVEEKKPWSSTAVEMSSDQVQPEPASVDDGHTVTASTPIVTITPPAHPKQAEENMGSNGHAVELQNGALPAAEGEKHAQDQPQGPGSETVEEERKKQTSTTVIDEKVVVENGGQQKRENLNLVRVPIISGGKRESAIMRLSNRIKVLEQNVSLSSRFLEELSRRYKKQSEDMMKMLNRTREALKNATVEAAVKDSLHEEEVTEMEKRLSNLTQIIQKLTRNFEDLRQATDTSRKWIHLEICIIIIVMLFLHFRVQPVTNPPEVKVMPETIPKRPQLGHIRRHNSFSGSETPAKEKQSFSGGGLQRFNTFADQDIVVIPPKDGAGLQQIDLGKKKKKKKNKNAESRLFSNADGPYQGEFSSAQPTTVQSSTSANQSDEWPGNQSQKISLSRQTQSANSYDSLLNSGAGSTKQRSNSLGTVDGGSLSTIKTHKTDKRLYTGQDTSSSNRTNKVKGLSKKPPVSGGSRLSTTQRESAKTNTVQDTAGKNDGWTSDSKLSDVKLTKGHKRQKSLPKQHYCPIEPSRSCDNIKSVSAKCDKTVVLPDNNLDSSKTVTANMKKSVSLPVSSASNFETPPHQSHSFVNGHVEYDSEYIRTDLSDKCYSLQKSQSDIYGSNVCKDSFNLDGECQINGNIFDDLNDYSGTAECEELGAAQCSDENEIDSSGPVVHEAAGRVTSSQSGLWRNLFGVFR